MQNTTFILFFIFYPCTNTFLYFYIRNIYPSVIYTPFNFSKQAVNLLHKHFQLPFAPTILFEFAPLMSASQINVHCCATNNCNCTSRQAAVSSDKNTLSSEMRMRLQIYSAEQSMFTGVENTVTIDVQTRGYPGCITCFWFIALFQIYICLKHMYVSNTDFPTLAALYT